MSFGMAGRMGLWVVGFASLMGTSSESNAQSYDFGGTTCVQNYSLYDYYSDGQYVTSAWEPDGVSCFDNGSGGTNYGDPYYGGGGSGGSIDTNGVWVTVPTADGVKVEVNLLKKQVRTQEVSCSDADATRQVVAGRILAKDPYLKSGSVVTVFFKDGKQTFTRMGLGGTTSMQPTSQCG